MRLFYFTAVVCTAILCACTSSYPPVCYQQIYHLDGTRTDADKKFDRGTALPVPEYRTELQRLYAAHPAALKKYSADAFRLGWFFNQKDLIRTCGEGIADLCNHAAWFVLHCVKDQKKQAEYAERIAKLMLDFDEQGALELLAELRITAVPGGTVQEVQTLYDPDNQAGIKTYSERYAGTVNGKQNPRFGIYREYHPNQMLALDMFYYAGSPLGYAFTYTDDGKLNSVYFYDGKGGRDLRYSRK